MQLGPAGEDPELLGVFEKVVECLEGFGLLIEELLVFLFQGLELLERRRFGGLRLQGRAAPENGGEKGGVGKCFHVLISGY